MKVTQWTRAALASRRQARQLKAQGFERIDGPWDLDRGARQDHAIVAVEIDVGGKAVWVKVEKQERDRQRVP